MENEAVNPVNAVLSFMWLVRNAFCFSPCRLRSAPSLTLLVQAGDLHKNFSFLKLSQRRPSMCKHPCSGFWWLPFCANLLTYLFIHLISQWSTWDKSLSGINHADATSNADFSKAVLIYSSWRAGPLLKEEFSQLWIPGPIIVTYCLETDAAEINK